MENELTMIVKLEGMEEAIEKAKQLNELLVKAQDTMDSLAGKKEIKIDDIGALITAKLQSDDQRLPNRASLIRIE